MNTWREYPFGGATAVLLDFGKPTEAHFKNTCLIHERLGVRVMYRDVEEILGSTSLWESDVEKTAQKWESDARTIDNIPRETFRDYASMFLAFLNVSKQEDARAMAINCGALPKHGLRFPCMPMVELYRRGVISACEADLEAMLTMMLLTHLAARPSFMGNVSRNPPDTVDINHCVAPIGMLEGLCGYEVTNRHGDHSEATVAVDLPRDCPATLARLSADLSEVHFAVGEIAASHHEGGCRNTVSVRLPDVDSFLHNKLGRTAYGQGHYVVVCADVEESLLSWARERDITPVGDTVERYRPSISIENLVTD